MAEGGSLIGGYAADAPLQLLHAAAHTGSERKRPERDFFGKADQRVPIGAVFFFPKQFQHGGIAGRLPVDLHFLQGGPYKRIEPVKDAGQIHKIIGKRVLMLIMLQLMKQHITHIHGIKVGYQVDRHVDPRKKESGNHRGFQKSRAVNRNRFFQLHLPQTFPV